MENNFKNGKITPAENGGFIGKFITRGGAIITVIASTIGDLFKAAAKVAKILIPVAALLASCSCSHVEHLATVATFADGTHTDTIRYVCKTSKFNRADTIFSKKSDAVFKTWRIN